MSSSARTAGIAPMSGPMRVPTASRKTATRCCLASDRQADRPDRATSSRMPATATTSCSTGSGVGHDPGGSGALREGARLLELDPLYCDVILRRFHAAWSARFRPCQNGRELQRSEQRVAGGRFVCMTMKFPSRQTDEDETGEDAVGYCRPPCTASFEPGNPEIPRGARGASAARQASWTMSGREDDGLGQWQAQARDVRNSNPAASARTGR